MITTSKESKAIVLLSWIQATMHRRVCFFLHAETMLDSVRGIYEKGVACWVRSVRVK